MAKYVTDLATMCGKVTLAAYESVLEQLRRTDHTERNGMGECPRHARPHETGLWVL
jgi:hypothetical protein